MMSVSGSFRMRIDDVGVGIITESLVGNTTLQFFDISGISFTSNALLSIITRL
jgi:hypothetical protein